MIFYSIGLFLVFTCLLVIGIYSPMGATAYTYAGSWWLGNSPSSGQDDSSGEVLIYYTYPDRVAPGENFSVGMTIDNKKNKNVKASWIAFTDVALRLRNYSSPHNGTISTITDDKSVVVEPGKKYSHSFELTAPEEEGRYLVFPYWLGWFGPGSTVLSYFEWDMDFYYNKTRPNGYGEIPPSDFPPINVTSDYVAAQNKNLGIEVQMPYGLITPVNVTVTSEDNQFSSTYQIKGSSLSISLPGNSTYNIKLQNAINLTEGKIRAVFDGWTDGNTNPSREISMNNDYELFALFRSQYYLQIDTDKDHLGYVHGTGWYDSGTEASYFLDPSIDIRSKFDHWEGNIASGDETPSGHLLMDGPKLIVAKWRGDFTYLTGIAGSAGVLIGLAEFLYKRHTIIPILSGLLGRGMKSKRQTNVSKPG